MTIPIYCILVVPALRNVLLPNLMNQVLDVAELFKSLNVDDADEDPVW